MTYRVAIVGTGFAGLGMAARLKRSGVDSFVVLERADDVGGTWRDNTYPGAACDVPSHLYSLSFRLNPDWSRVYAPQPEIHAYLRRTASEEGLTPHLRLGEDVLDAVWDGDAWEITTSAGNYRAAVLVTATGHLCDPKLPDIPGLGSFGGRMFHSARWDHSAPIDGGRVGVIGSGASGVQIVPQIVDAATHVTVFQRSAPYLVPRPDRAYSPAERGMFRRLPEMMRDLREEFFWSGESRFPQRRMVDAFLAQIETVALGHLAAQVPDPALRAVLTPDYTIGCKRILVSSDYYPAVSRDDVSVETAPIRRVTATGVQTADGHVPLDVLVLATGFEASDLPISHRIRGRGGVRLSERWADGEQALACTAIHGYPNLFVLNGPNSGLGAGSVVYMIESQIEYVMGALSHMASEQLSTLEATAEAEEAFAADLERRSQGTVWLEGGCSSWYVDPRNGRLTTIWPDFMSRFRAENGTFTPAGYATTPGATSPLGLTTA